jgi:hypothetical protein
VARVNLSSHTEGKINVNMPQGESVPHATRPYRR